MPPKKPAARAARPKAARSTKATPKPPERMSPEQALALFRPYIGVQFRADLPIPYENGIGALLERAGLARWADFVKTVPGAELHCRFPRREADVLVERARKATPTSRAARLFRHFALHAPQAYDLGAALEEVRNWPAVERAWIVHPTKRCTVVQGDDPIQAAQLHHDPAPVGVDAEFAWTMPGGNGAGTQFGDLEHGWLLSHEDIAGAGVTQVAGVLWEADRDHGTAVLGIVLGQDNTVGVVGHAPATVGFVASSLRSLPPLTYEDSAAGLVSLGAALSAGGVVLIELGFVEVRETVIIPGPPGLPPLHRRVDFFDLPLEFDPAVAEAILALTDGGVTVVEAAANGSLDLDAYRTEFGFAIFNPSDPTFGGDTGAILVGACDPGVPHARSDFSNFGLRVNCCGWGRNVVTASGGTGDPILDSWNRPADFVSAYQTGFNGTSSASAVIAGVALQIQGIARANFGRPLTPRELRDLLSNPALGTPTTNGAADRIGALPDLRRIFDVQLRLNPISTLAQIDIWLRDFLGDSGTPHEETIGHSPDIILTPRQASSAELDRWGEGGSHMDAHIPQDANLVTLAEGGWSAYTYLRARNRGDTGTITARAYVYASPLSSLLDPSLWQLAGTSSFPTIPAGNRLTVSRAMPWLAADPSAAGTVEFTLLGVVVDPQEQQVFTAGSHPDLQALTRFIQQNNNLAIRHFSHRYHYYRARRPFADEPVQELAFVVAGPYDTDDLEMDLEIGPPGLPKGSKLWFECPLDLARRLGARTPWDTVNEKTGMVAIPLFRTGQILGPMRFPKGARWNCRLLLHVPKAFHDTTVRLSAAQRERGVQRGRAEWTIGPAPAKSKPIVSKKRTPTKGAGRRR